MFGRHSVRCSARLRPRDPLVRGAANYCVAQAGRSAPASPRYRGIHHYALESESAALARRSRQHASRPVDLFGRGCVALIG